MSHHCYLSLFIKLYVIFMSILCYYYVYIEIYCMWYYIDTFLFPDCVWPCHALFVYFQSTAGSRVPDPVSLRSKACLNWRQFHGGPTQIFGGRSECFQEVNASCFSKMAGLQWNMVLSYHAHLPSETAPLDNSMCPWKSGVGHSWSLPIGCQFYPPSCALSASGMSWWELVVRSIGG